METFANQVSTDVYLRDVLYAFCTSAVLMGIVALTLIDLGLARQRNAVDVVTQKIVASIVSAAGFAIVGFGVWNSQYYHAFGIKDAFWQSISDWWIGGYAFSHPAQYLDPARIADADVFQVFAIFFLAFAAFLGAAVHTIGVERMRASAVYVTAFLAGAVLLPVNAFLVWGSVSPLTNRGVHDFIGGLTMYVPLGVMSIILSWRLRPRLSIFKPDPRISAPAPTSLPMVGLGVLLAMVVVPFFALGSGFIVSGQGYFGISMTTSGFGLVIANIFMAFLGGGLSGALLSYRLRNPFWAIAGPFTGYVSSATVADTIYPWVMFVVALGAPIVAWAIYKLLVRIEVDDSKLASLVFGPALWGVVVGGFTEWGVPSGGYFGITSGPYAFQHAHVTPLWQLIGIAVVVTVTATATLSLCFVLNRTMGLRVTDEEEIEGFDSLYWVPAAHEAANDHSIQTSAATDGFDASATSKATSTTSSLS